MASKYKQDWGLGLGLGLGARHAPPGSPAAAARAPTTHYSTTNNTERAPAAPPANPPSRAARCNNNAARRSHQLASGALGDEADPDMCTCYLSVCLVACARSSHKLPGLARTTCNQLVHTGFSGLKRNGKSDLVGYAILESRLVQ